MKKFKRGDVVLVKWDDACSNSRWWRDKEIEYWAKEGAPCKSVGFYFGSNKNYLTLYMNKNSEEMGQLMNIPLSIITKVKILK